METNQINIERNKLIEMIMSINNMDLLKKVSKSVNGVLHQSKEKEDNAEYITKEELLAGIDAGLKDVKAGRTTSLEELINEL